MADHTAYPDWIDCRALRAAEEAAGGWDDAAGLTGAAVWRPALRLIDPEDDKQEQARRKAEADAAAKAAAEARAEAERAARERAEADGDTPASQDTTPTDRLQDLQPLEMFRDAFKEKHSVAPSETHERVFHEVLAAAATEE